MTQHAPPDPLRRDIGAQVDNLPRVVERLYGPESACIEEIAAFLRRDRYPAEYYLGGQGG